MKSVILLFLLLFSFSVFAAQKATIVGGADDPQLAIPIIVYAEDSFDSEPIANVNEGETYMVSNKVFGNKTTGLFYRIQLKDKRIGYIADYYIEIQGKGRAVNPKDLDDELLQQELKRQKELKNNSLEPDEADEEGAVFGKDYSGLTLQLINYHENTLGGNQTADLLALGYKSVSTFSWSVIGSYGAPKYYAEKTGGRARGVKLWGDVGFSSTVGYFPSSEIRVGGSVFTHVSLLTVETSLRKYELNDVTAGLALEAAWMLKFRKSAFEAGVKYYFDKSSYAAFGLSYLF